MNIVEQCVDKEKIDKLSNIVKEISGEWQACPKYWSNNKRKRKGIPLRRKQCSKKQSYSNALREFHKVIEEIIFSEGDENCQYGHLTI